MFLTRRFHWRYNVQHHRSRADHLIYFRRFNNVYQMNVWFYIQNEICSLADDSRQFHVYTAWFMCESSARMQPKETISKTVFPVKILTFLQPCLLLVSVSSLSRRLYKYKLNSVTLSLFSCETVIEFWKLVSAFICLHSERHTSARTESNVNYWSVSTSTVF